MDMVRNTVFGTILMVMGFLFTLILLGILLATISDILSIRLRSYKRKIAYRNRMKKLPTAKCYCIDCAYATVHRRESGEFDYIVCGNPKIAEGHRLADSWFCCWGIRNIGEERTEKT